MTSKDIIVWKRASLRTAYNSFKDDLSPDQSDCFDWIICNAKPKDLDSLIREWNILAHTLKIEKSEKQKEYNRNHKYCHKCEKTLRLLDFKYKKRIKYESGELGWGHKTHHLLSSDICVFCYKTKLENELLDNDWYAKNLLRKQGVKNITDEMVKTKKLTLLIKKHIKDEKES